MHPTLVKVRTLLLTDLTAFGSAVFFAAAFLLTYAFTGLSDLTLYLISGGVLVHVAVILIRLVYHKDRPKKESYRNIIERLDASSFPSLHAARASLLALLMAWTFPSVGIILVSALFALSVCISRIMLRKHDLIDVAAGAVLGGAIAALVVFL